MDDWAKKVCDQVQPQVKKIQQANASINGASRTTASPEDVQKTDSAAFQEISDAYKSLPGAVSRPARRRSTTARRCRRTPSSELNSISKAYSDLKKQVDGLDTKDQAKFADGLKGVATKLDKLSKSGDEALKKLQSGDVGKAMAKQKGCKRPGNARDSV